MAQTRSATKKALETRKPTAWHAYPKHLPQRSSLRIALESSRQEAAPNASAALAPPPARSPARRGSARPRTKSASASASSGGWHGVRAIVAEAGGGDGRLKYLVDWEGHDPRSGAPWPNTWVDAKNVTRSAKREWEDKKKDMQKAGASASAR
ncbi:hypothetical protein F4818DRAFT_446281 [Hypoxylon cercidicola]|nr:hypothetical protein F4818DRAFT_446281 [Hypoxylon cercidicola]